MPISPVLALVGFIGLCLLVGLVGGTTTAHVLPRWYSVLHAPPGTPPSWVFAPVWGVLYVMIGVAGWLVWKRLGAAAPLRLWGWQLAANAMWAPAFFGLRSPPLGMVIISVLLLLVVRTILTFKRFSKLAALLMTPYFVWCCYAAYLNAGFLVLNPT
jgi:translocator protein